MVWPLPELDITGFTTQGSPTSATAAIASSRDSANLYRDVMRLSSRAANSRMPSRFMVSWTALAEGATRHPSPSSVASISVSIASISGMITSGLCVATAARTAFPSSIEKTSDASATCIAGAFS